MSDFTFAGVRSLNFPWPSIDAPPIFARDRNVWVEHDLNELVSFPFGRFNDLVDSLVHVLILAALKVNRGGWF